MYEYKTAILRVFDLEKQCNVLAAEGWRLISTAVVNEHKIRSQVLAVFEREKSE